MVMNTGSQIGYPVGDALKARVPEIEQTVVTRPVWGEYLSSTEKLTFHEENGQYVNHPFTMYSLWSLLKELQRIH